MLPKKLHIEQIDRFHNRMETISIEIKVFKTEHGDDTSKWSDDIRDKVYKLTEEYFLLSELWCKIDDFIEYGIKHKMDILKDEPQENWWSELKED